MRRPTLLFDPLLALLLIVASGCALPGGPEEPETPGSATPLELRIDRDPDRGNLTLRLFNGSTGAIVVGVDAGGDARGPMLRLDAMQPDGSWVPAQQWRVYRSAGSDGWPVALTEPSRLEPGASLSFGEPFYPGWASPPGSYRATVDVTTARGGGLRVSRELGSAGWPVATVDRAMVLFQQAGDAGCGGTARDVLDTLLRSAEPDGLLEMYEALPDEATRLEVRDAMVARGGFVARLRTMAATAPLRDVLQLARRLSRTPVAVQAPVKRATAQRLLSRVRDLEAPVSPGHYDLLAALSSHWPAEAPALLVQRLGRGPDEGYSLMALIDVFVYEPGPFEGWAAEVYRAVSGRCAAAVTPATRESCERALRLYDPRAPFHGGFGRGSAYCSGCRMIREPATSRCEDLRGRWRRLRAAAPELDTYTLDTYVLDTDVRATASSAQGQGRLGRPGVP